MSFKNPERQKEIASMGGRAAQATGKAHRFTPDEAKAAGQKAGKAILEKYGKEHFREMGRRGGKKVSADIEHMSRIGQKGGTIISQNRAHMAEIAAAGVAQRASNAVEAPAAE